jgi:hypothetical protein
VPQGVAYADDVGVGVGARALDEEEGVERGLGRVVQQDQPAGGEVVLAQGARRTL